MVGPLIRTPPTGGPALGTEASPPLGRRRFLGVVGLGAGTLAVAGAAGLTWRSVEGGVFATATGPAYGAWDEATLGGQGPMGLVCAAVLAANAHNAHPWHFAVTADRIDLFADGSRTLGAMDPLLREMYISLGCAIENLVLAGPPNGLVPTVGLMPDPRDRGHVARVELAPTREPPSPLWAAIANRHTDRAPYDTARPVDARQLDELGGLVDAPDTELVWFTGAKEKRDFRDLTVRAPRRSSPTRSRPPTTSPGTAPTGGRSATRSSSRRLALKPAARSLFNETNRDEVIGHLVAFLDLIVRARAGASA